LVVGLDTNILCYSLDPAYPEHGRLGSLLLDLSPENVVAINPTIIHEAYHTLVFGQKFAPAEASRRLQLLLRHPFIEFYGQTRRTCLIGMNLAVRHGLGGRDALIIANFIGNKVPVMYTHDGEFLSLKRIAWKASSLEFKDPLTGDIPK
jgi:predicted nucleic acid-binding protein